jgi:ABC-type multidrug transport system ATPase subunit
MGPSGCGKTSLCKALARRLPSNRVLGDIRVLCSSAADGYKSESALAVCGRTGRLAQAKCDLAHMTGYVPQFDLLHESLTVSGQLMSNMSFAVACVSFIINK